MRVAKLICSAIVLGLTLPVSAQTTEGSAASRLPPIEYLFETTHIRGNDKTSGFFFRRLLGLSPGELVRVEELDRYRRQLLATGFFSTVETRLAEGSQPEHVIVEVDVVERNTILVSDVYFGVSSQTPIWGGIEVAETNLLGSGLLLSGGFVLSPDQGAGQLTIADPFAALGLRASWSLQGFYQNGVGRGPSPDGAAGIGEEAFEYERFGGRLGFGPNWTIPLSTSVQYRVEGLDFTFIDPISPHPATGVIPGTSLLSTIGVALAFDRLDHPTLSRRGYRVGLTAEGGGDFLGSDYTLFEVTGHVRGALPLGDWHTLRLEAGGGYVWTPEAAPYFEGFYVGDFVPFVAGRSLGLQFSDRRSLDVFATGADLLTYGDAYGSAQVEWAVALARNDRIELFVSTGFLTMRQGPWAVGRSAERVTSDPPGSTNTFRTDLTFDMGFRANTPLGLFGLSIGNVLALLPLN